MSSDLSPTLWRTCRALANHRRLRIMRHLMQRPSSTVSGVAQALGMPRTVASQYLRMLNARGLLQPRRWGRHVYYRVGADPAVPQAAALLQALESAFRREERVDTAIFAALTGFTHPRRIAIARALAGRALSLSALRRETRMSRLAAVRHLRKLMRRGYVTKTGYLYRCARPTQPLPRALLDLAVRRA